MNLCNDIRYSGVKVNKRNILKVKKVFVIIIMRDKEEIVLRCLYFLKEGFFDILEINEVEEKGFINIDLEFCV